MAGRGMLQRRLGFRVALLVLGFAVVGWGLQMRLAQYGPASPQKAAVHARACLARHSAWLTPDATHEGDGAQRSAFAEMLSGLCTGAEGERHQPAEVSLYPPSRVELHGVFALHRPPPSLG